MKVGWGGIRQGDGMEWEKTRTLKEGWGGMRQGDGMESDRTEGRLGVEWSKGRGWNRIRQEQ